MIHSNTEPTSNPPLYKQPMIVEHVMPLPSVVIDFMAVTLCDLIPPKRQTRHRQSTTTTINMVMPELVYFIQKITFKAAINCRTALVALIYLGRAKSRLPRKAVGGYDTCHRLFLGSVLLASKFLQDSSTQRVSVVMPPSTKGSYYYPYLTTTAPAVALTTSRQLTNICGGLFSLQEVNQLERAFLRLIGYHCWIDDQEIEQFVKDHRGDFLL